MAFFYAFRGIFFASKEIHFKIHILATIVVICTGLYFQIKPHEWLAVLLCCGTVISLEMVNTAIERLVDDIHKEKNENAKIIKDISAGAVLIMSIVSLVVGFIVFYKYIF